MVRKQEYYIYFSECTEGTWNCTQNPCPATCQVVGALHYITFDSLHYSLGGKMCYYDLVRVSCILYYTIEKLN